MTTRQRLRSAWRTLVGKEAIQPSGGWLTKMFGLAPEQFSPSAALEVPAVQNALLLVSGEVARLPRIVEHMVDGKWEPVDDSDPEARIVSRQWLPGEAAGEMITSMMCSVMLLGAAVVYVVREGGQVRGLVLLDKGQATRTLEDGRVRYWATKTGSGEIVSEDVVWLDYFGPPTDRVSVIVPLARAWSSLRVGIAASRYASTYLSRGATGDLFYSSVDAPDADMLSQDVWALEDEMRAQGRRSLGLPPGTEVTRVSSNMRDSQLVQIAERVTQDVARIFQVPPTLLQDLSRSNYSTLDATLRAFTRFTVQRWADRLSTLFSDVLWPAGTRRLRFDADLASAESPESLTRMLAQQIAMGITSQNEARIKLGMYPSDDPIADELIRMPQIPVGPGVLPFGDTEEEAEEPPPRPEEEP